MIVRKPRLKVTKFKVVFKIALIELKLCESNPEDRASINLIFRRVSLQVTLVKAKFKIALIELKLEESNLGYTYM